MGWLCCPSHSFKHQSKGDDAPPAVGVKDAAVVIMWGHRALRVVKACPSSGRRAACQSGQQKADEREVCAPQSPPAGGILITTRALAYLHGGKHGLEGSVVGYKCMRVGGFF